MAVFRVEKTRDYTVMANHHLKNRELSLKAKGLLSVMLSLPDNWDYTLKGLSLINREGVDAIREAVKELERAGYIVRTRVRNEKGQLTHTEYVIYEKPRKPEIASPASESPAQGKPVLEKPVLEKPVLENPILDDPAQDDPALENPALEHPTQLNTYGQNTDPEKTYPPNPHAANPYPSNPHPSMTADERSGVVAQVSAIVKSHIGYDVLIQQYGKERLDEIVLLMVEVLCSKAPTYTISGEEYPAELVRDRLCRLSSLHIQYVFECLARNASPIRNIKAYLLTTLFNAPATLSNYYDAQVRHDGF